jgi:hypothetical protein
MTSPWGLSPWGTGGWGAGPTSLVSAYAISTNDVVVNLSAPVLSRRNVVAGDANNPNTWAIVRVDTNSLVPIAMVTQATPTQYILHTQVALPPQSVGCIVSAETLLDATGTLISLPRSMTFFGVTEEATSTPELEAASQTQSPTDLLNRLSPSVDGSYGLSGTLVVRGGDYTTESGLELLRKLIVRRLVTTPGDFYHLPSYGCGLKVKSPLPASGLMRLQTTIKQQVSLEQGVSSVTVGLTQSDTTLFVQLGVTVQATGQRVDMNVPFQIGAP